MAQLTTEEVGFGYLFPYFPTEYGWAIGTQGQYDALDEFAKASIIDSWDNVGEAVSAITATNPTEPVTIYILDRSTDVSGIPATINGQAVTVSFAYCGACDASFGFGFGFNF